VYRIKDITTYGTSGESDIINWSAAHIWLYVGLGADSASMAITGSSRGISLVPGREPGLFVAVNRVDLAMFSGLTAATNELLASLAPR